MYRCHKKYILIVYKYKLGVAEHTCIPGTGEAGLGGFPELSGRTFFSGLFGELQASEKACLKGAEQSS